MDAKVSQQKMVPNYSVTPMEDDVYVVMLDAKTLPKDKGFVSHTVGKRRDALSTVAKSNHRVRMACASRMGGQNYAPSADVHTQSMYRNCADFTSGQGQ